MDGGSDKDSDKDIADEASELHEHDQLHEENIEEEAPEHDEPLDDDDIHREWQLIYLLPKLSEQYQRHCSAGGGDLFEYKSSFPKLPAVPTIERGSGGVCGIIFADFATTPSRLETVWGVNFKYQADTHRALFVAIITGERRAEYRAEGPCYFHMLQILHQLQPVLLIPPQLPIGRPKTFPEAAP